MAKDALSIIGIQVTGGRSVVLTDRDSVGERAFTYLINPSQLEYACDQYRLTVGESIDYEGLEAVLPWLTEEDFQ
ncbi:hypothetical protein SCNU_02210 [Gordonia neofelifaecis NRRL B-59395]|uniref:Uncharacterized protein n=2 Tax=Gordonia TaxID=2053 RepID=F1YE60_9ACTN|nr:hypothetical protein SCNU_02210 [Gordonia neofelifaecis NRRL B-59395]